jgi:quinol monooxygenase YgiN
MSQESDLLIVICGGVRDHRHRRRDRLARRMTLRALVEGAQMAQLAGFRSGAMDSCHRLAHRWPRYWAGDVAGARRHFPRRRRELILATTTVEDFDRFLNIFSTKGAEKRKQYGCKGASVFRDPNDDDRVWVLYDWDEGGLQNFLSDPEVPAIIQEAGYKRRLQAAELSGQYDS